MRMLRGIAASPGIVMSKAVVYDFMEVIEGGQISPLKADRPLAEKGKKPKSKSGKENYELSKFASALEKTKHELELIRADFMSCEVQPQIDDYHSRILDAQLLVLEDPTLINSTIDKIKIDNLTATQSFRKTTTEIMAGFKKVKNEYIRARVADIKDVTNRVLRNLKGQSQLSALQQVGAKRKSRFIGDRHIVIAKDLSPSDTARLNKEIVSGFATELGGSTSHTAIMGRAIGIPAVVGISNITDSVKSGDEIIIDGNHGIVIIEPDESTRRIYEDRIHRFQVYEKELLSLTSLPCRTLDGHTVDLAYNIELPEEIDVALVFGASAIGLMRTEFIYLKKDALPSEEEQFEIYDSLAQKVNSITIRTLDLGGDKLLPNDNRIKERNPALGWRGIRVSLAKRNIFNTQLKAIIRTNRHNNVRILLPMVQSLDEVKLAKSCIKKVAKRLAKTGIHYGENIEIGVMIEVPSAAIIASAIAKEVDFLSIGSNDLTQYMLACDRTNPMVAHIYNPLHPAVIKLIKHTVEVSHSARKWVSLCGELASYPPAIPILVGMGIDELSVAPIYLLEIKKIIRSLSKNETKAIAEEVSGINSEIEMKKYVNKIRNRFPVIEEIMSEYENT
ncbi:MAG: phosphoenolpyruvate--protein phosphotransferase [Candidatus Stahlbacteria bacterium]|nr:phosphoenolpyruvate--protein phosphotransferase [Candidatus Stahlbacteria bacterium]